MLVILALVLAILALAWLVFSEDGRLILTMTVAYAVILGIASLFS